MRLTLSQRITLFSTLGFAAIWLTAILMMSVVLWSEEEELFDQQLVGNAQVLLSLLSQAETNGATTPAPPHQTFEGDEALIYRLIDKDGQVLRQFDMADRTSPPNLPGKMEAGITDTADYRVYTTPFNAAGHAVQIAAPQAERREAFWDSMTGFTVPMLAVLPLTWLLTGWVARRSLAPMRELRAEISARDGSRLDPIDASDWPEDLVQIAGTLNGFLARLTQALEGERAFATNAAHELRTPVTIALAQVQQLRTEGVSRDQRARIDAMERALQRMRRLVARLLQLARADAGVGFSTGRLEIVGLTRLVLADSVPRSAADRIRFDAPRHPVTANMDPDAYAIILGNLVENAFQHGPADTDVVVAIGPGPVLEVSNEGPAVPALEDLPRRFHHRQGEGFGLGLHICAQIVNQSGGRLELVSPLPGRKDGFMARVHLRSAGPEPAPNA